MSHSTDPVFSLSKVDNIDDISEDDVISRPSALIAVLTLLVGMVSGSAFEVTMSNAVRISDSWEGVRPVATDLPVFRRLDAGYTSVSLIFKVTIWRWRVNLRSKFALNWKMKFNMMTHQN